MLISGRGGTINGNVVMGNTNGIVLESGASSFRVYENRTMSNAWDGIANVANGPPNTFFSNTSSGNGRHDLLGEPACGHFWGDNIFKTSNSPCIR
jgi:parallel beta-helix repeat protein